MGVSEANMFVDPIDSKNAVTNSQQAKVGSIAIFDPTGTARWDRQKEDYWFVAGHVGIVTKVDENWNVTEVADWNWDRDKKYQVHAVTKEQSDLIQWYFDPTKAPEVATTQQFVEWSIKWIPVSYERGIKNMVPATLMNSEVELKALNDTIERMYKWGIAQEDAALTFMWFNVEDPEKRDLAMSFVNVARSLPEDMQNSYVKSISDFINSGNEKQAMTKSENTAMNYAKKLEWDNYISEATVKTAGKRSDEIVDYVNKLEDSPIGVFEGTMEKWLGKLKWSEAQQIMTDIVQATAQMRNKLLWSAVTPTEMAYLDPLIPSINDSPANFMIKLQNLKDAPLQQLNDIRTNYWLPELNTETLNDKNKRLDVYRWTYTAPEPDDTYLYEDIFTDTWWAAQWAWSTADLSIYE